MTTLFRLPRRNPRPAGQHRLGTALTVAVPERAAPTRMVPVAAAPDVTEALEPLRGVIEDRAPLTCDLLERVRDGLRASMDPRDDTLLFRVPGLDHGPGFVVPPASLATPRAEEAAELADEPEPETFTVGAAQLRAVIGGQNAIFDPLGHYPSYAGWSILPDGRPVAGMYLGTNEDGFLALDVTDPAWIDAAISALEQMRDDLTGTGDAQEGDAA
jgi:hypothetical protein